jgi:hypothetical protein
MSTSSHARASNSPPQRTYVERQLFSARRALTHLVDMYENGQCSVHYANGDAFAEAVRKARETFDYWKDLLEKIDRMNLS